MKARRAELLAALAWLILGVSPAAAFESGRADFMLTVNDNLVIPYRVFAVYVLPGERLEIMATSVANTAPVGDIRAEAESGALLRTAARTWSWSAPLEPGVTTLTFAGAREMMRINAVILHPVSAIAEGRLNGYRIGEYPVPLRGDPGYAAPDGFIELNAATTDLELSPHFRLAQFPSKQSDELPKYLILREQLLLKLELLLEHVNAIGIVTDTFTIMSGFRTPTYNRAIGNGQHSRHIYGGAADIYIDVAPRDDLMDDLNGDDVLDYRDAQWLYRVADALFAQASYRHLRGGLGVYRKTSAHGPFLHMDARGTRARWGLLP